MTMDGGGHALPAMMQLSTREHATSKARLVRPDTLLSGIRRPTSVSIAVRRRRVVRLRKRSALPTILPRSPVEDFHSGLYMIVSGITLLSAGLELFGTNPLFFGTSSFKSEQMIARHRE